MNGIAFGKYLRQLRLSRKPIVTQEKLGEAIGRGKMTISQFELGKNPPPNGALLKSIIEALSLNREEEKMLIFLSAKDRKDIPYDIEEYFFSNPSIYEAIRNDMNGSNKIDWDSFIIDSEAHLE